MAMLSLSTQPLLRKIRGSNAKRFEDIFGDEEPIEKFLGATSIDFAKDVNVNKVLNKIIEVLKKISEFKFNGTVTDENRQNATKSIIEFINLSMHSPIKAADGVRENMLQELAKILNEECGGTFDPDWGTERLYSGVSNFIIMLSNQSIAGLTYHLGSMAIMTSRMKKMIDILETFVSNQPEIGHENQLTMKGILGVMNHITDACGAVLDSNRASVESIIQNREGLDMLREIMEKVNDSADDKQIRQMLKYYYAFMTIENIREIAQKIGNELNTEISKTISKHGLLSDNLHAALMDMREEFKNKLSAQEYELWGENIERLFSIMTNQHYSGRKQTRYSEAVSGKKLKPLLNKSIQNRLKDSDSVLIPQRTIQKSRMFSDEWDELCELLNSVVTYVSLIENMSVDMQAALLDFRDQMKNMSSKNVIGIFAKGETQSLDSNEKTVAMVATMSIKKLGETLEHLAELGKAQDSIFSKHAEVCANKCKSMAKKFTEVILKHSSIKNGDLTLMRFAGRPEILKNNNIKDPVLFTEVKITGGSIVDKAMQVLTDSAVLDTAAKVFLGGDSKKLSTQKSPGCIPLHMLIYPDGSAVNGRMVYGGIKNPKSAMDTIEGKNDIEKEPEVENIGALSGDPAMPDPQELSEFDGIDSEFQLMQGKSLIKKPTPKPVGRPKAPKSLNKLSIPQLDGLISYEDTSFLVGGRGARDIDVILVPENTPEEHGFDKINQMATRLQYNISMANNISSLRLKDLKDPESRTSAMVKSGLAGFRSEFRTLCDKISPMVVAEYSEAFQTWNNTIASNIHVFESLELLTSQIKKVYTYASVNNINLEMPNLPEDKFGESVEKYYNAEAKVFQRRHNLSVQGSTNSHVEDTITDPVASYHTGNLDDNIVKGQAGTPNYSIVLSPEQTMSIISAKRGEDNMNPIDYLIYLLDEVLQKAKKNGIDILETRALTNTVNSCGLRLMNALSVNFVQAKPAITMFCDTALSYVTKTSDDAGFVQMIGEASAKSGTIANTSYKEFVAGSLGGTLDEINITTNNAGSTASQFTDNFTGTMTITAENVYNKNATGNYYPMPTGTPTEVKLAKENCVIHTMGTLFLSAITSLYGIVINGHKMIHASLQRQKNRRIDEPLDSMVQIIFGNKAAAAGEPTKDSKVKTYDEMEVMDIEDKETGMIKSEIFKDIFGQNSKYRAIILEKTLDKWPRILKLMAFKFGAKTIKHLAKKPPVEGGSQPDRSKLTLFLSSASTIMGDVKGGTSIALNQMDQLGRLIVTGTTLKKIFFKMNKAIKSVYKESNLILVVEKNGLYSEVLSVLQSSIERVGLAAESMGGEIDLQNFEDMQKMIIAMIRLINKTKAQGVRDTLNGLIQCFNKSIMVSEIGMHDVIKSRANMKVGDYNPYTGSDFTIQNRLARENYVPDNSISLFNTDGNPPTLSDQFKEMAKEPDDFSKLYDVTLAMTREIIDMTKGGDPKTSHIRSFGNKLKDAASRSIGKSDGLEQLTRTAISNLKEGSLMEPIDSICSVVLASATRDYGFKVTNLIKMLVWASPISKHTMLQADITRNPGSNSFAVNVNSSIENSRYDITTLNSINAVRAYLPSKIPEFTDLNKWKMALNTNDICTAESGAHLSTQRYFEDFEFMKDSMVCLKELAKLSEILPTREISPQEYVTRLTSNFDWLNKLWKMYDINNAVMDAEDLKNLKKEFLSGSEVIGHVIGLLQTGSIDTIGLRAFIDSCVLHIGEVPLFNTATAPSIRESSTFTNYIMGSMFPHGDIREMSSMVALRPTNILDMILLGVKKTIKNPQPTVNIHTLAHAGIHKLGGPLDDRIQNQAPSVLERINTAASNIARACMVVTPGTNTVTIVGDVFKGLIDVLERHVSLHDTYPDYVTAASGTVRSIKQPMNSSQEIKVDVLTKIYGTIMNKKGELYFDGSAALDSSNPIMIGLPQNGAVVSRSLLNYLKSANNWMFDGENGTQVNVFMNPLNAMEEIIQKHINLTLANAVQELQEMTKELALYKYSLTTLPPETFNMFNRGYTNTTQWAFNFGASPNKPDAINDLVGITAANGPHMRDQLLIHAKSSCDLVCSLTNFAHTYLDKINVKASDFESIVKMDECVGVNPMPLVSLLAMHVDGFRETKTETKTTNEETVLPLVRNSGMTGSLSVADKETERNNILREINIQLATYTKTVANLDIQKHSFDSLADRITALNPQQYVINNTTLAPHNPTTQGGNNVADLARVKKVYSYPDTISQSESSVKSAKDEIYKNLLLSNKLMVVPNVANNNPKKYIYTMSNGIDASGNVVPKEVIIELDAPLADNWKETLIKMHSSMIQLHGIVLSIHRLFDLIKREDNTNMYLQSLGFPPQFKYETISPHVGISIQEQTTSLRPLSPNIHATALWYNTIMCSYFLNHGTQEQHAQIAKMYEGITKNMAKSTTCSEALSVGIEYAISISNQFIAHLSDKFTHTEEMSGTNKVYPNTTKFIKPISTMASAISSSQMKEKVLADTASDNEAVENAMVSEIFKDLGISLMGVIRGIFGNDTNFPNILLNSSMFIDSTKSVVNKDIQDRYQAFWQILINIPESSVFVLFASINMPIILQQMASLEKDNNPKYLKIPHLILPIKNGEFDLDFNHYKMEPEGTTTARNRDKSPKTTVNKPAHLMKANHDILTSRMTLGCRAMLISSMAYALKWRLIESG